MVVDGILGLANGLIDRLWPDPATKAEALLKAQELQQNGDLAKMAEENKINLAQVEINKIEAASSSLFVAGWRPAVGWICVIGLFYTFQGQPMLTWISSIANVPAPPKLDMEQLLTLLFGMLGLGGMRTFEKIRGK